MSPLYFNYLTSLIEKPDPEAISLFSCSTELSMEFQMLIKTKMLNYTDFSCFQALRFCTYHAYKGKNANTCGILTFMSMINFMLS